MARKRRKGLLPAASCRVVPRRLLRVVVLRPRVVKPLVVAGAACNVVRVVRTYNPVQPKPKPAAALIAGLPPVILVVTADPKPAKEVAGRQAGLDAEPEIQVGVPRDMAPVVCRTVLAKGVAA